MESLENHLEADCGTVIINRSAKMELSMIPVLPD
jgi:hypothetical protein